MREKINLSWKLVKQLHPKSLGHKWMLSSVSLSALYLPSQLILCVQKSTAQKQKFLLLIVYYYSRR